MREVHLQIDLFSNAPARALSELALAHMLAALVAANRVYLRGHPGTPDVYRAGVVYKPEPIGSPEKWKGIGYVLADGHGDCEDLACWRVAWLQERGIAARPVFYSRMIGNMRLYHIIVQLPGGRTEDPSRALGMEALS